MTKPISVAHSTFSWMNANAITMQSKTVQRTVEVAEGKNYQSHRDGMWKKSKSKIWAATNWKDKRRYVNIEMQLYPVKCEMKKSTTDCECSESRKKKSSSFVIRNSF